MSDEKHDTDPPPDPLVAILSEQTSAIERLGEVVGAVAREMAHSNRATDALLRQFSEQAGKREAAEVAATKARVANNLTLELIRRQVESIGKRFSIAEQDIDELKVATLTATAPTAKPGTNGTNGNGNGHG